MVINFYALILKKNAPQNCSASFSYLNTLLFMLNRRVVRALKKLQLDTYVKASVLPLILGEYSSKKRGTAARSKNSSKKQEQQQEARTAARSKNSSKKQEQQQEARTAARSKNSSKKQEQQQEARTAARSSKK